MVVVGSITLLVKGFGFFKEMTIGRTYGLSELLDTFLIAVLIPGFMNNVFMSSFQNVFVPNYVAEQKLGKQLGSFQSATILLTFILALLLSVIAYLLTDKFLEFLFSGHTANYYYLVRIQFYCMIPCILFWSFSAFLGSLLEINNKFKYSSIYPIITALVMLVCLYFLRNFLGKYTLAIGMLLGSFCEMIYLLIIVLKFKILKLKRPDFLLPNIGMMYRQLPSKATSLLLNGFSGFVNQIFAGKLIVGSIAAINYGLKIPAFISGILIIAIGNVAFPYFSKLATEDKKKAFKVMKRTLLNAFILSASSAVFVIFISVPLIKLLFQKGNFSAADSIKVGHLQQIIVIYVPFYIGSMLIMKFLTSINKNNFMAFASLINLFLTVILNYVLAKTFQINGIAIATTLVYIINFTILLLYLNFEEKRNL
jgi:putative peptidoglycan lipid II flippase